MQDLLKMQVLQKHQERKCRQRWANYLEHIFRSECGAYKNHEFIQIEDLFGFVLLISRYFKLKFLRGKGLLHVTTTCTIAIFLFGLVSRKIAVSRYVPRSTVP